MTTDVNEALEAKRLQFTGIEKRVMNHGKADKLTLGVLERLKDSKAECRVTSDVTKLKVKRRRPAVACTRRVACRVVERSRSSLLAAARAGAWGLALAGHLRTSRSDIHTLTWVLGRAARRARRRPPRVMLYCMSPPSRRLLEHDLVAMMGRET